MGLRFLLCVDRSSTCIGHSNADPFSRELGARLAFGPERGGRIAGQTPQQLDLVHGRPPAAQLACRAVNHSDYLTHGCLPPRIERFGLWRVCDCPRGSLEKVVSFWMARCSANSSWQSMTRGSPPVQSRIAGARLNSGFWKAARRCYRPRNTGERPLLSKKTRLASTTAAEAG